MKQISTCIQVVIRSWIAKALSAQTVVFLLMPIAYVRLFDGSNTSARYAPLTYILKMGHGLIIVRVSGRGDVHISASKTDDTKTADTIISNNSELRAQKSYNSLAVNVTLPSSQAVISLNQMNLHYKLVAMH